MFAPLNRRWGVDLLLDLSPATEKIVRSILLEDGHSMARLAENTDLDACLRCEGPSMLLLEVEREGDEEDGFARCARLRREKAFQDLSIILLLSQALLPRAGDTYPCGADDFVPLPPRPLELRSRVRAHLALARMRRMEPLDPLTGLHGLSFFQQDLDREWHRTLRSGAPIAIITASVDAFEKIEALLGCEAGKAYLAAVGHTLAECVDRSTDLLARVGPDTFACALPDTDVPGALAVVQRMQASIEDMALPHPSAESGRATLSFGFSAVFSTQLLGPEELLFRAHRNLLRAQDRGGNCWSAGEED